MGIVEIMAQKPSDVTQIGSQNTLAYDNNYVSVVCLLGTQASIHFIIDIHHLRRLLGRCMMVVVVAKL